MLVISNPRSGDPEKPLTYDLIECNREQDWPDDVIFNDGYHEMTYEEWSIHNKPDRESDEFDVDPPFGGFLFPLALDHDPLRLHRYINLAMEEYCKNIDGKKLKLKEPIHWNVYAVCPFEYYITFTAEDEETREVETYQAKVQSTIPKEKTYVDMVRVKPKKRLPDASPLEENSTKKLCQ